MSTSQGGGNIITDSLVLSFDAANIKSFPRPSDYLYDLTTNKNVGTINNQVSYVVANYGSFSYNTGGVIQFSDVVSLNTAYTINIWYRQTAAAVNKGLVTISGASGSAYFYVGGNTTPVVTVYNGSEYGGGITPSSPTSWNMVTWVRRGNTYLVYLNGGDPYINTLTIPLTNNGRVFIGNFPNLGSTINGNISMGQIYNRELTKSEIEQIYRAGKGRYNL